MVILKRDRKLMGWWWQLKVTWVTQSGNKVIWGQTPTQGPWPCGNTRLRCANFDNKCHTSQNYKFRTSCDVRFSKLGSHVIHFRFICGMWNLLSKSAHLNWILDSYKIVLAHKWSIHSVIPNFGTRHQQTLEMAMWHYVTLWSLWHYAQRDLIYRLLQSKLNLK